MRKEIPEMYCDLFLELHRLVNEERRSVPSEQRISLYELAVLALLDTRSPLGITQIIERLRFNASTMTRRICHLEECGFLQRKRSTSNRRHVMCYLTPMGQARFRNDLEIIAEGVSDLEEPDCPDYEELCEYLIRAANLPMPADSLILAGYALRAAVYMTFADIARITALGQSTISMSLHRLEYDGLLYSDYVDSVSDYAVPRADPRIYCTDVGLRFGAELIRLIEEL